MNRIKELISSVSATPELIVHLGAGTCGEHECYKAIGRGKVLYVEADQDLAEAATESFKSTPQVKVIPAAIATENGLRTLNITNNRQFSSLLLPGGLTDFYPNIEVYDKAETDAITLSELCRVEEISEVSDNLLVAELQGMEREIFPQTKYESLQKFRWIIIRSSETDLYAPVSDRSQTDLLETMQAAGFMVLQFNEEAPPFINILCIRNEATLENTRLKNTETRLLETVSVLENNLSEQGSELDDLQTSHLMTITELQGSLDARTEELSQSRKQNQLLVVDKENQQHQIGELVNAINSKSDETSQLQTLIQSIADEKENQKINELTNSIEAKSTELNRAKAKIQTLVDQQEIKQGKINELSRSIEIKFDELDKAQTLIKSLSDTRDTQQKQLDELAKSTTLKSDELDKAQTLIKSLSNTRDTQQKQLDELAKFTTVKSDELDKAQAQIKSLSDTRDTQQKRLDELAKSTTTKSEELDEAQTLIKALTHTKESQQKQLMELAKSIAAKSDELESTQTLIVSLTNEVDERQKQLDELTKSIDAKSEELEEAQAQIQTVTTEQQQNQQQIDQLTESIQEKSKEITEIRQMLQINNKIILKSDTDLKDLQLQYRAALQHQEQQHILLFELRQKLQKASEYYQKLNMQSSVFDINILEQDDSSDTEAGTDGGEKA